MNPDNQQLISGNSTQGRRLKVLMSAYACEPGKGSEPAVGWNMAMEMAKHHDVWVLTRANNRQAIDNAMNGKPVDGLHFIYHDLPSWASWWKRGGRGIQLYYYLWQITAISKVREEHAELGFNLSHHVTFVKYWAPSCLAWLDIPFVWGPVGGGDGTPFTFLKGAGLKGFLQESARDLIRLISRADCFVRKTAKNAAICIPVTTQTDYCVHKLNHNLKTIVVTQVALSKKELYQIDSVPVNDGNYIGTVFLYVGNLLFLKGIHLAMKAFAHAEMPASELWIVGDGPEKSRLSRLAEDLKISNQVRFVGRMSREEVLIMMKKADVIVHPSLHDSGGFVPLEAMACGKPVICLNLAGPAVLVSDETGVKIEAKRPSQTVNEMADAMRILAENEALRHKKGLSGRRRVEESFLWEKKAQFFADLYRELVGDHVV